MALRLPYPYPDPITGELDLAALFRNLLFLSRQVFDVTPVRAGGTGITAFAIGDLVYASTTTALARRAIGAAGRVLQVSGGLPVWSDFYSAALGFGASAGAAAQSLLGWGSANGVAVAVDNIAARVVVPFAGTLRNLYVVRGAAPGAGNTNTYTVRQNGVNTAIVATISGASATTGADLTNSITVVAGDLLEIAVAVTAGAPTSESTTASVAVRVT